MPTPTYDLIASNVLSSNASSITFSSIPATYRDLILVIQPTSASGGNPDLLARFNGDSGSNYNIVAMTGTGTSATSFSLSSQTDIFISSVGLSTNAFLSITQIMDYSATDKHKTCLIRNGRSSDNVRAQAVRWANTAAINQISMTMSSGTMDSGSTFYLYGIVS